MGNDERFIVQYEGAATGGQGNHQLVILSQLIRQMSVMKQIDEIFIWLAQQFMRRFDVQVVQFWATQQHHSGQRSFALRSYLCKDSALPLGIVNNEQVMLFARQLLISHMSSPVQTVDSMFSSYQVMLMKRYHLQYCLGYYMSNDALLKPPGSASAAELLPAPLRMVALFFLPHSPSPRASASIGAILDQALYIAREHGLLLPVGSRQTDEKVGGSAKGSQLVSTVPLARLIPRRLEQNDWLKSSNPLSGATIISDKQVRRLYKVIDGHKTIAEIAAELQMPLEMIYPALRLLLNERWIQLCEPSGKQVDGLKLLQHQY